MVDVFDSIYNDDGAVSSNGMSEDAKKKNQTGSSDEEDNVHVSGAGQPNNSE